MAFNSSLKLISSTNILLYSLAILGRECASEFVKNVFPSSSDMLSARFVSELSPNSIASTLLYFSLKIFSSLSVQFP